MQKSCLLFITAVLIFSSSVLAQTTNNDKIDTYVKEIMQRHELVGLSVSIWHDGNYVYNKGLGYANMEQKIPIVQGKTLFQVASLTKLFTGLTLLKLVEENVIKLEDRVYKYIPEFTGKNKDKVTLRMLIDHTGGVRGYLEGERDSIFLATHYQSARSAIEIFLNDTLIAEPGKEMNYTSYGYNLIAAAMEVATNTSYKELVQSRVIKPLGLNNTYFGDVNRVFAHEATAYSFYKGSTGILSDSLSTMPDYYDYSYNLGGGNILTTTEDLINIGKSLLPNYGFFNSSTYDLFYSSGVNSEGIEINTGFGVFIYPDSSGRQRIYTTGAIFGYQAGLQIYPAEKLIIAVTSNTWGKGENRSEVVRGIPIRASQIILDE